MAHPGGAGTVPSAVDANKPRPSGGSVKHGGSGVLNVYGHPLATTGDHYHEARRQLLASPHLRRFPGAFGQMWSGMTPWLPPAAALSPAADSLYELALTPSDTTQKLEFIPQLDVLYDDEKKEMVLLADLPGCDEEDISVAEDDGALIIKGELSKEDDSEQRTPHNRCLVKERRSGCFVRRFQLPKNAVNNGFTATIDKGVLRVNTKLQKSAAAKKSISIK